MTTVRRSDDQDRSQGPLGGRGDAHPSFLALDRAALGSRTASLSRHLVACSRCRAHVERIADPAPLPESASARLRPEIAPRRAPRPLPRRTWIGGLAAAAAVVALFVALLVGRDRDGLDRPDDRLVADVGRRPPGKAAVDDGIKGGRAVGVYVRRGSHTFLWDGSAPVEPGDALRLKLVPDGMTQVHVFGETGGARARLALLHRADIAPDRDALLDTAWRVDGAGGREVLVVVLSRRPLSRAAAEAAARAGGMGEELWVARLVLAKQLPGLPALVQPGRSPDPAGGEVRP
jgi:hypothetical protein